MWHRKSKIKLKRDEGGYYWAGFWMADGCVSRSKNKYGYHKTRLSLQRRDGNHVHKFKEYIGGGHVYDHIIRSKQQKRDYMVTTWVTCSNQFAENLKSFGIIPGKSKIDYIYIPDEVKNNRHFWRGVIDGDGHIRKANHCDSVSVVISGGKSIVEDFDLFVHKFCETKLKNRSLYKTHERTYQITYTGKDARDICSLLYKDIDENISLDRKYDVARYIAELPDEFFLRSNNKSGITGVFYSEIKKRWVVKFKSKHIGYFYDKKDAILCRKELEDKELIKSIQ